MQNFEAVFYVKSDGTSPVREFIVALEPKMRAKVVRLINMLETNGTELREPYSKHLRDGVFELRVQTSSNASRVLYFYYEGRKVVLTHGFIKKTQTTPPKEIERAIGYRREYLERIE
ncbi:toxin RelE [Clostridia bacterium]|nr:toxin RelE [Clostridia bacterium]